MYKSSLQELCQSKKWKLPVYTNAKQGQDHCPLFGATVMVNDCVFSTPLSSKSVKDAQNLVAKIAYEHFMGTSSVGASQVPVTSSIDVQKQTMNQPSKPSSSTGVNFGNKDAKIVKDMTHLYKNQLQTYAQKRNLSLPEYRVDREGPPHAFRFKSAVVLEGKTYQSNEYFNTLKDAENAAAKVALMSLSSNGIEEEYSGVYKNLLHELAQREYCVPVYSTICSGPPHLLVFVSTVKVHEASFTGQEAKTKKLAEFYAAKVAYLTLKERNNSSSECHVNDSSQMLHVRAVELLDRHISEPNPESNAFEEQVNYNIGVHGQGNEVKLTETCPSTDQVHEPEMDAIPFLQDDSLKHIASFGVGEISSSSRRDDGSSRKRIKVFPATPNMKLPDGVVVMRKDDKWVAVTMDSS